MSSVYAPRRILCVPDNAYSLAVTSTEIVVGTSESEKLLKNQLIDRINHLSIKYAIPSELICSSKNLVKLIKEDNTLSIKSGWRSELFKL